VRRVEGTCYRGMIIRKTSRADRTRWRRQARSRRAVRADAPASKARPWSHHQGARRGGREVHSLAGVQSPRSRATAASPGSISTSPTPWVRPWHPGAPTIAPPRRHPLDRRRRHLRGLGRRRARSPCPIGERRPRADPCSTTTRRRSSRDRGRRARQPPRDISHAIQTRVERDGSRSSAASSATASAATCTRTRRSRTSATRQGPELEQGMVLAIEPMVNAGGPEVRMGRRLGVSSGDDFLQPTSSSRSPSPRMAPACSPPGTWTDYAELG
jgi:hypothetical protein